MSMNWQRPIAGIVCLAMLAGCAHTGAGYRPLVDTQGVDMNRYENDLRGCQGFAQQTADAGQAAAAGAVAGAVRGALLAGAAGRDNSKGHQQHPRSPTEALAPDTAHQEGERRPC